MLGNGNRNLKLKERLRNKIHCLQRGNLKLKETTAVRKTLAFMTNDVKGKTRQNKIYNNTFKRWIYERRLSAGGIGTVPVFTVAKVFSSESDSLMIFSLISLQLL